MNKEELKQAIDLLLPFKDPYGTMTIYQRGGASNYGIDLVTEKEEQ